MPKPLQSAKVTLSYPLYACDFDPNDPTRLVVGGGGGAGKSGIGNKITVFSTVNPYELEQTAELDLSKNEDNVTSLAVGQSKGRTTVIYAGVNSSLEDRERGKNEHFRVFGLETPTGSKKSQKSSASKISELSRTSLFDGSEKETYQRLVRLSKPFQGSVQLGAAATAFGSKEEEIILFDTTGSTSAKPNVRGKIQLDKEAEDVDVIQTGKDEFEVAYCTKYDIFQKTFSSKASTVEPRCITPSTAEDEKESKPVFRSLRFLSPQFLLMLTNLHGRSGAVLKILRLPPVGSDRISQAASVHLPSQVRQATGLAVCNLLPRTSASEGQGYAQLVIAVAGHDMSISLYTMDSERQGPLSAVSRPKLLRVLKDVHPFQITGLALSTFTTPRDTNTPQSLKLASISAGNTVVVHTLPLSPVPKVSPPRFIVSGSDDEGLFTFRIIASILVTLFLAFMAQIVLELRGTSPVLLNASKMVAPDVQGWIKFSHPIANRILGTPPAVITTTLSTPSSTAPSHADFTESSFASALDDLISQQAKRSLADGNQPAIIIREEVTDASTAGESSSDESSRFKVDLHDEEVHGPHEGKPWEELTPEEKARWTQKLKDSGHWVEDFGETIFKGVFFGMAGAAVGAAVGG